MSLPSRPALPSHIRAASTTTSAAQSSISNASTGTSPLLQQRIASKKAELASLKELQALSAGMADQMQQLEDKLSTLTDGTEAVAAVLSNWHNVLRAVNMASCKCSYLYHWKPVFGTVGVLVICMRLMLRVSTVAIAKPKTDSLGEHAQGERKGEEEVPLPVTLVRIPTEQAGLIAQATSAAPPAD
jgi:DASH complex subunit DAD2